MLKAHSKSIQVSSSVDALWKHTDSTIAARQHARRVQEKLGVDEGLIYLTGQSAKNNEDSDMPAPFRQRRYFYYLTGCVAALC